MCIRDRYSPVNSIVLDPFCGSGTTGVAAIKQNREFVGIELNKQYCKIAKSRVDVTDEEVSPKSPNPLVNALY